MCISQGLAGAAKACSCGSYMLGRCHQTLLYHLLLLLLLLMPADYLLAAQG
jgi:hypothetical protein